MFLYLGHAKGTREDCRVRAFSLVDERKKKKDVDEAFFRLRRAPTAL
jgi:hypothetical protein